MKFRRHPSLRKKIFFSIFVVGITVFLTVSLSVFFVMRNSYFEKYKESRLELLEQVKERSKMINRYTLYVSDIADGLVNRIMQEQLEVSSSMIGEYLDECLHGFYGDIYKTNVTVILKNGDVYTYGFYPEDISDRIKKITSSFWYISNFTNDQDDFWTIIFSAQEDELVSELTHGSILRDSDGSYLGVVLVGTLEEGLNSIYDELVEPYSDIFILDQNGKAISHSRRQLVGTNMYYMPAFHEQYGYHSSTIVKKNANTVLLTVDYDDFTGWTFVEEKDIAYLDLGMSTLIALLFLLFAIMVFFIFLASSTLTRKIYHPLEKVMQDMTESSLHSFSPIVERKEYREVGELSRIYNSLTSQIHELLGQVKLQEGEKHKMELSFLEAQINPHFLHNTLFNIRCLIELGRSEEASEMLSAFASLLKITMGNTHKYISLEEEMDSLKKYVTIMHFRYSGKNIVLADHIDDRFRNYLIPKMLLQPIVENAILHNLDEPIDSIGIVISASETKDNLFIRIVDNGIGIKEEDLETIFNRTETTMSKKGFNKIGLRNIEKRIQLAYGPEYGLDITSTPGQGTEVILKLKIRKED